MAEVVIKVDIPSELKEDIEKSYPELSKLARELIIAKAFEIHLSKSRALQKAIFEALAAKSRLTEEGAKTLASEIDESIYKELKEEFPEL